MFWDIIFVLGFGFGFASIGYFYGWVRGNDYANVRAMRRHNELRESLRKAETLRDAVLVAHVERITKNGVQ